MCLRVCCNYIVRCFAQLLTVVFLHVSYVDLYNFLCVRRVDVWMSY